jgi:SnoaL-like polyketide cyclase
MDARNSTREDYKQTITRLRSALSGFPTEALETIEQGNNVAFRFRTTGKHNNAEVVFEGMNLLRVEGGRIVEDWVYYDATGIEAEVRASKSSSAAS